MILIISKEKAEYCTEAVMNWLAHYKVPFFRVNGDDFTKKGKLLIDINNRSLYINSVKIPFDKITAVWFRRWSEGEFFRANFILPEIKSALDFYLSHNNNIIRGSFMKLLEGKKWLTHFSESHVNKLSVLFAADNVGFNIPISKIISSKCDLEDFVRINKRVISKDVNNPLLFLYKDKFYNTSTIEVKSQMLNEIPEKFAPTLFQELIEKKYEIRVFYLDGKIYSMAIFSQMDDKTSIDFRNYNVEKPNRFVPYKLDKEIKHKINELMNSLNLKTGSIDLIKGIDEKITFLEVNPVGQFSMVSYPCNYNLEKRIAEFLIGIYTTKWKLN